MRRRSSRHPCRKTHGIYHDAGILFGPGVPVVEEEVTERRMGRTLDHRGAQIGQYRSVVKMFAFPLLALTALLQ